MYGKNFSKAKCVALLTTLILLMAACQNAAAPSQVSVAAQNEEGQTPEEYKPSKKGKIKVIKIKKKELTYELLDGLAIIDEDIIVGTEEDLLL